MQQQQLLSMGDPAGAVMISEDVQPNEYVNDGYIWLALTHHLLGAGHLEQVRHVQLRQCGFCAVVMGAVVMV
jgi:hypothetical protein